MMSSLEELVYKSDVHEPVDLTEVVACLKDDLTHEEVQEVLLELHNSREEVQEVLDRRKNKHLGLCARLTISDDLKDALFSGWIYHTGDYSYPVPDPQGEYNAHDMYNGCCALYEGDYGDLRLDLAQYFIDRSTALLELYGE